MSVRRPSSIPVKAGSARGFTLIEILLVLALIALLSGVLAWGTTRWLNNRDRSPSEKVWDAVQATRRLALLRNADLVLTFEEATLSHGAALIAVNQGQAIKTFDLTDSATFKVNFLSSSKKQSFTLIGGDLVEGSPLTRVTFYADGTCSPFRLQILSGSASEVVSIDPWTCAPVIKEKKEGSP